MAKRPPSDWAYIARKINQLTPGKPAPPPPAPPPAPQEPQLVEVRPYLSPSRIDPEPQPSHIAPPPDVLNRSAPSAPPAAPSEDPTLKRLLALWPQLTQRDREELFQIARLKHFLNTKQ